MEEAERLCDRVAIMDHGKVIALGTPRELMASIGVEHVVEFSDRNGLDPTTVLGRMPGVREVQPVGTARFSMQVTELHRAVPALLETRTAAACR